MRNKISAVFLRFGVCMACLFLFFNQKPSESSYLPVVGSNIGIGTSTPVGALTIMSGNVGIGTWSPTSRLQVIGTVSATAFVGDGSGLSNLPTTGGWTDGGTNVYTSTTTDNVGIGTTTPTAALLVENAGSQASFRINDAVLDSSPFIIDATGSVGIGTTNPDDTAVTNKLHKFAVVGDVTVAGAHDDVGQFQIRGATSSAKQLTFGVNTGSAISYGWIQSSENETAHRPLILNPVNYDGGVAVGTTTPDGAFVVMGGNVGIGTWSVKGVSGALIVAPGAGNVGIGTVRPGTALDVNGVVRSISGGFTFPDGTTQTTAASGASGWTDGGTNVYTSTTTDNVGIGTTTPLATLDLGSVFPRQSILIYRSTNGLVRYGMGVDMSGASWQMNVFGGSNGADGHISMGFVSSSDGTTYAERARLTETGNFGIGTTTPVAGLAVMSGNVGIGTWSPTERLQVKDGLIRVERGSNAGNTTTIGAADGSNIGGVTLSRNTSGVNPLGFYFTNSGDGSNYGMELNTSNDLVFYSHRDPFNAVEAIRIINNSANIGMGTSTPVGALTVMHGNVGIGTWSPTSRLQVIGTVNATAFVGDGSGLTNLPGGASGWTDGGTNVYTTTTTDNVGIGTTTPTAALLIENAGTQDSLRINDAVLDVSPFVIDAGGNVGIGTTVPISILQIAQDNNYDTTVSTTANQFIIRGVANPNEKMMVGLDTTDNYGYITSVETGVGGLPLVLNTTRVGIGPGTTLSAALHLNETGVGSLPAIVMDEGGGDTDFWMSRTDTDGDGGTDNDRFDIGRGTTPGSNVLMSVMGTGNVGVGTIFPRGALVVMNGNVGIGTTSPAQSLHVANDVQVGTNLTLQGNLGAPSAAVRGPTSGDLILGTNGATNLYLDFNGNVGVGGAPTANLQVLGSTVTSFRLNSGNVVRWDFNLDYSVHNNLILNQTSGGGHFIITGANVGIATVDPKSKLAVSGGVGIGTAVTSNFLNTSAPLGGLIVENNVGIGTVTPVGALTVMNGNVGIGTWSPTSRLQVIGTVNATAFVGDGSGLTNLPGGASGWTDGGTNVYTSTTTDNVGIGTTTPVSTLTIAGNIGIGTYAAYRTIAGPNNGMILEGNLGIGTWGVADGKLIVIGGNVGLGTVTPGARLAVMDGNVGIGTWAPQGRLVVMGGNVGIGNVSTNQELLVVGQEGASSTNRKALRFGLGGWGTPSTPSTTSDGDKIIFMNNANLEKVVVGTDAFGSLWFQAHGALAGFEFWTGASGGAATPSQKMVILNSGNVGIGTVTPVGALTVMNGNVGIGTWSPTSRLQVIGTVNATAFVGDGSGLTNLPGGSSGWTDGGTNVYTSTTSDNVAIGTTTPSTRLTVVSDGTQGMNIVAINSATQVTHPYTAVEHSNGIDYSGMITAIAPKSGDTVAPFHAGVFGNTNNKHVYGLITATRSNSGWDNAPGALSNGNFLAGLGIAGQSGGSAGVEMTLGASIVGQIDATVSAGVLPTSLLFHTSQTNASGLTERMRITSAGLVGIGTVAPASLLTVRGNVGIGTTVPYYTIAAPANGMIVEGNVGIGTFAAQNSKLAVMGGNVGIGTTIPSGRLTIQAPSDSQDHFTVRNSSGNPILNFSDQSGRSRFALYDEANNVRLESFGWASAGPALFLNASNDNEVDGNWADYTGAGIYVYVQSVVGAENGIFFSNSSSGGDAGAGITYYVDDTFSFGQGGLNFKTSNDGNSVTRMTIDRYGNVGVGTRLPNSKFVVNGGVGIGTTASSAFIGTPAPPGGLIVEQNVGIGTTNPRGALTVMNGNVGIGTWSPTSRLQVIGTVNATAFVGDGSGLTGISAGGWSDGGTNVYTTTTTDNVGIGTTTPTAALLIENTGTQASFRVNDALADGTPFIITSDGNVGIGTTTPNNKISFRGQAGEVLDMYVDLGGSTRSGIELSGSSGSEYSFDVPDGATRTLAFHNINGGWLAAQLIASKASGSNNNGALTIKTSGHNRSQLYLDTGGNVGIGTTRVSSNFVVNGGVGIGTLSSSTFINTAAPSGGLIVENNVGIGTTAPVGALSVMRGKVGIGTWSPQANLEVVSTEDTNATLTLRNLSAGPASGAYITVRNDVGSLADFGIGSSAQAAGVFAHRLFFYQSGAGITFATQGATDDIRFFMGGIAATDEKIRIAPGGNLGLGTTTPVAGLAVMNGNVGIGTWSPTSRLQVIGTVNATAFVGDGSGLTGISAGGWSDGGTNVYTTTTTDNVGIGTTTPTAVLLIENAGSQDSFRVNDSVLDGAPFVIDAGGSVGIGTTVPGDAGGSKPHKLAIVGDATVGVFHDDVGQLQIRGASTSAYQLTFGINTGASVPYGWITSSEQSGPPKALVLQPDNGNVGIGTNAPLGQLIVIGGNVGIGTFNPSSRLTIPLGNIGIGSTLPYRRIAAPTNGMAIEGNVGIGTWTANAGKLIVRGGNVGIGTSYPGGLLDIYTSQNSANNIRIINENNGNAAESNLVISEISNQAVALGYMNSGLTPVGVVQANSGLLMTWAGASNGLAIGTDASAPIVFFTAGYSSASNERMRITSTGNIGIGTLTPVAGLTVMNGNVGIGTWSPTSALEVRGAGAGQITMRGPSGGCLMFRDTDDAGWTECNALNGVLTCSLDADGVCDGS